MRIPPVAERDNFFNEVATECLISRSDRISDYERWRAYFLWGCDNNGTPATYNQILPKIGLLASFLFAAETTKFGITIGESAKTENELAKAPTLARKLNSRWADSNADIQYGQALMWSLVYGTMLVKLVQRKRFTYPYIVDPHSFGVLDEDMPMLDDQDAFVHTYTISSAAFGRILADHPKRALLEKSVTMTQSQGEERGLPQGVARIVMSTLPMTGVDGPGQVNYPGNMGTGYRARTADDRVQMRELWVWDDVVDDYRIATMAGGVCVYDRPNVDKLNKKGVKDSIFYLPGEHPFIQVCPNPAHDYFWGYSEVDSVTRLQDLREYRLQQIKQLLDNQVKPPSALRGMWQGITDETNYALQVFGASISSADPTATVNQFAPTIPADTFAEIREIDDMFNETMGLSNVVQGKGESGVRSKGQTDTLARLGSSRIRGRAYRLEDGLDKIGMQYLKLIQQHDPEVLTDELGRKFIPEQFTGDYEVKIDGHSSSPIFVEDHRSLARDLFEARAIDRAELIEILDPPGKQVMLEKLKIIEKNEKAAAKAEADAEAAKQGLRSVK